MDIYNNLNVTGDVKANKVNLSDRVVVSVDGITNGGLQYCFPACSGTIATQSYVDEKTCGIVIDAYTKAEVDEKVNCLEGSIASVETDVSNKASQFSLTCHESKVGGSSQIGHVKVASSFGSSETCVVPSLSLVCSTFGGYVTTTCLNAYKNTTTCNFNFIAGCIEGVRCYVADVESDLTTAKQNIQQNASDIASLQASSGCLENVYTKTQVDDLLANKANCSDIPDVSGKADKATTLAGYCISDAYTKTEVDDILSSISSLDGFCSQDSEYCVKNLVFSAYGESACQTIYFGSTSCATDPAILTVSGCICTLGLRSCLIRSYAIEGYLIKTICRPTISTQESIITWDDVCSRALVTKLDVSCYVESKLCTPDTYTKTEVDDLLAGKANSSDIPNISGKADKATTLDGYGIVDSYTKTEVNDLLANKANSSEIPDVNGKADKSTTLAGYGITDAYTKTEVSDLLADKASSSDIPDISGKADKATTLAGYCISDAYTKTETDTLLCTKASQSTTLSGYGITNAYTKTEVDEIVSSISSSDGFCSQKTSYCVENLVFSATDTSSYLTGQEIHFGATQCSNNAILTVFGCAYVTQGIRVSWINGCSIDTIYRPAISNIENSKSWDTICSCSLVTKSDVSSYICGCVDPKFNSVNSQLSSVTSRLSSVESQLGSTGSSNIKALSYSEYQSLVSQGSVASETLYVIV